MFEDVFRFVEECRGNGWEGWNRKIEEEGRKIRKREDWVDIMDFLRCVSCEVEEGGGK